MGRHTTDSGTDSEYFDPSRRQRVSRSIALGREIPEADYHEAQQIAGRSGPILARAIALGLVFAAVIVSNGHAVFKLPVAFRVPILIFAALAVAIYVLAVFVGLRMYLWHRRNPLA